MSQFQGGRICKCLTREVLLTWQMNITCFFSGEHSWPACMWSSIGLQWKRWHCTPCTAPWVHPSVTNCVEFSFYFSFHVITFTYLRQVVHCCHPCLPVDIRKAISGQFLGNYCTLFYLPCVFKDCRFLKVECDKCNVFLICIICVFSIPCNCSFHVLKIVGVIGVQS